MGLAIPRIFVIPPSRFIGQMRYKIGNDTARFGAGPCFVSVRPGGLWQYTIHELHHVAGDVWKEYFAFTCDPVRIIPGATVVT